LSAEKAHKQDLKYEEVEDVMLLKNLQPIKEIITFNKGIYYASIKYQILLRYFRNPIITFRNY